MLHIEIHSFSYKKGGIPHDSTDNGGGFVFDCRGILNPGRIDKYKTQTGADPSVQNYLENHTEMPKFLENIKALVSITIDNYIERGFKHLQISFGCTGGQHRSVYSALTIGKYLQEKYSNTAKVNISHDEQPQLNR